MIALKEIFNELKINNLGQYLAAEFISEISIIREDKGMTQQVLSEKSGVPHKTISRLENGEEIPTLDTIGKLLTALGYTATITYEEN